MALSDDPTPVQLQILRKRFPGIGEPALRRNWQALLGAVPAGLPANPPERSPAPKPPPREKYPVTRSAAAAAWSAIVAAFFAQSGISPATLEYRFAPPRRWRFDYAWPADKVALEVEGGVWTEGRHTRGAGFLGDMEKYNEAVCCGWRVVRVTPTTLLTGETADMIRRLLS